MASSAKKHKNLSGRVLAAMPALQDPNFIQTLVYIVWHDEAGAFGLVLNRPGRHTLAEVSPDTPIGRQLGPVPVHQGGPVHPDRLYIGVFRQVRGKLTCDLGLPIEQIEAHVQHGAWVRAFAGYSGWGEGQLEKELEEGAWKVCRPDSSLFEEHLVTGLWRFYVSGDTRWKILQRHLPRHPERN